MPKGAPTDRKPGAPHLIALGTGSQRWNWFLAADYMGKWIVVEGSADVTLTPTSMEAVLYLNRELAPYHSMSATISHDRTVKATVASPGPDRPAAFTLVGEIFFGPDTDVGRNKSVLLTDGTTVLGLAFGPKSLQP